MINIAIGAVILGIIVLSVRYIYKEKKKGKTCIGCPYAKQCGGKCSGGCSGNHTEKND